MIASDLAVKTLSGDDLAKAIQGWMKRAYGTPPGEMRESTDPQFARDAEMVRRLVTNNDFMSLVLALSTFCGSFRRMAYTAHEGQMPDAALKGVDEKLMSLSLTWEDKSASHRWLRIDIVAGVFLAGRVYECNLND